MKSRSSNFWHGAKTISICLSQSGVEKRRSLKSAILCTAANENDLYVNFFLTLSSLCGVRTDLWRRDFFVRTLPDLSSASISPRRRQLERKVSKQLWQQKISNISLSLSLPPPSFSQSFFTISRDAKGRGSRRRWRKRNSLYSINWAVKNAKHSLGESWQLEALCRDYYKQLFAWSSRWEMLLLLGPATCPVQDEQKSWALLFAAPPTTTTRTQSSWGTRCQILPSALLKVRPKQKFKSLIREIGVGSSCLGRNKYVLNKYFIVRTTVQ